MDVNRPRAVRNTHAEETSAAKAASEVKALIAALEALRHPKSGLLSNLFEGVRLAIRMFGNFPPEFCMKV